MGRRVIIVASLLILLSACDKPSVEVDTKTAVPTPTAVFEQHTIPEPISTLETQTPEEPKWTSDELQAMVLTLAGECYDDKEQDKRLVCEVILNRVSDGRFGDSIIAVITGENPTQFVGYWRQSRSVSDSDLQIAEQTLEDWFANDCEALSEYLFFCAGDNRENSFR